MMPIAQRVQRSRRKGCPPPPGSVYVGRGCAMLVRSAFTESEDRWPMFRDIPPAHVLQFVERVVMLKGRLIRANAPDPFNLKDGQPVKASTATSYCWLVWHDPHAIPAGKSQRTLHHWIAPCRRQLEQPGDYPEYPDQWAAVRALKPEGELL